MAFRENRFATRLVLSCALVLATVQLGNAKSKHSKSQPAAQQDEIDVIANIPSTSTEPITHFLETQHYRHEYLYAEHGDHQNVTLIDVSSSTPHVVAELTLPAGNADKLFAVTGNAALVESGPAPTSSAPDTPETFRIMSFADPLHPTVKQEFKGVTAISTDEKRGLIFLANADGIWILHQTFALSPEDEALQKSILHSIYDTP